MESFQSYFPYEPLQNTEIRLITIQPGDFDSPIECSLKQVDRHDRPHYRALSYVWGDPKDTTPIAVDGMSFPVTLNLAKALQHVRDTEEYIVLWADAICIDQKNDSERSHQVLQMAEIYHSAASVIIWLGEEDDPTWRQNTWAKSNITMSQLFAGLYRVASAKSDEDVDYEVCFHSWSVDHVDTAYYFLFTRPWFSRRWVIQELALGQVSNSVFICGTAKLPWRVLKTAMNRMHLVMSPIQPVHEFRDFLIGNIRAILECVRLCWTPIGTQSQLTFANRLTTMLLCTNGRFKTSDPRDHIYSMIGMARTLKMAENMPIISTAPPLSTARNVYSSDMQDLYPASLKVNDSKDLDLLTPDYTRPAREVFVMFARYLLEKRRSLDIIVNIISHKHHMLPSWVPNWHYANGLLYNHHLRDFKSVQSSTEARIHFSSDSTILYTKALPLGEVVTVDVAQRHPELGSANDYPGGVEHLLRRWHDTVLCSPMILTQNTDNAALMLAWKTTLLHPSCPEEMEQDHMLYDDIVGEAVLVKAARDRKSSLSRMEWNMTRFLTVKAICFTDTGPFVTSKGTFGLSEAGGPFQVGDKVCLVPGASVPLAIRKDGDMWRLIGPCYLYGYMDSTKHPDIFTANEEEIQEFALK